MLSGMRAAQKGWLGKLVMTVMFGFLILSFGIWGIGDIFRIAHREVVASVGSTDITSTAYRLAFQDELQRLSSQARRNVTSAEAFARGIDRQVLLGMIADAAFDQKAKALGLAISNATITRALFSDPTFKDPNGQFNPARFAEFLRQNGYTEEGFLRDQRGRYLRTQISAAVAGAPPVGNLMLEALHRFSAESRAVDYVVLPQSAAGDIAPPDDAALSAFYEARKSEFAAPEYRAITFLHLDPEIIPEKRSIERIPFKNKADAEAAEVKLKAGASFESVAAEQGLSAEDLSMGEPMTKSAIADKALADAAFSLAQGTPSEVIDTKFGPVILRVAAIEASRGQKGARELHDKIEDQRAAARPISEIATGLSLSAAKIDAVDAQGNGKDGKPVEGIPDKDLVLRAAFQSEVGGDNDAVALRDGGFVWYDVTNIERAHDRPLAEVKDDVVKAWTDDQRSLAVAKKASELVKSLEGGTPIADIASANKLEVVSVDAVTRASNPPGLSPASVNAIFAVKADGAGYALGGDGLSRIVFKVKSATLPPAGPAEAEGLAPRLKIAIEDDIMQAYVRKLEQELGLTVDEATLRAALRGSEEQQ